MPPRPSRRDHHNPRRKQKAKPLSAGRRPHKHTNLTTPVPRISEDEFFDTTLPDLDNPFLLILDGIQDPHNLGACLRSANAAGVHAVIAPKDKAAPLTETVRRVACGAAEHTPFIQVTNLARAMKKLQDAGLWLVGTADEAEQILYDIDLKGPLAIVLGAEEKGVRRLTRENCDFLARIPMTGQVDCLNVSVATGVCLFEALRQRLSA
ncbi:MAG: 23S rRNA (guanosine(2251)-2'-O)-methyltransferase RlmB [Verrucomicrobiota bacterium]